MIFEVLFIDGNLLSAVGAANAKLPSRRTEERSWRGFMILCLNGDDERMTMK
jgi:hypothetical protein